MRIDIITIFPKMFAPVVDESIIKRARLKGKLEVRVHDLRAYTPDKHRKVDDRPFGGGAGMVMSVVPICNAVEAIRSAAHKASALRKVKGRHPSLSDGSVRASAQKSKATVILLCPQGKPLTQALAKKLSKKKQLILICGRYEGVDERVRKALVDEEISIGDYILTGGELPAMVLVDALTRLIPGVLGDKNSLNFESFEGNLLEYPQYTRPAVYKDMRVPQILLSGNHEKIQQWRNKESLKRTRQRRPDLLKRDR